MAGRPPIPLVAAETPLNSPDFGEICRWPFADPFVRRLLHQDVPQRVLFGKGRVFVYRDPAGQLVGFGSLDICDDYKDYTGGRPHPYIPLLAVNPTIPSLGYGTSIVRHLIDEAALLACGPGGCHDVLFLDVYTTSTKAIQVYTDLGFVNILPEPLTDPEEGGKQYLVMARRVSVAPA